VLSLLGGLAACGCAGTPEDRAKDCALAFARAVEAKDLDTAVRLTAVPLLAVGKTAKGYHAELVETPDEVRAKLQPRLDQGAPAESAQVVVVEVVPAANVKDRFGAEMKPETFALVERVMGPDGFVVVLSRNGQHAGGLIVAMRDGGAKVTGSVP
jgi:hypothetical protein